MYDRHLDSFIKVAELGSFSKAGTELFISANAVTKQVDHLERDLGVRLFIRDNRGVTLTAAGKEVYRGAKRIIAEAHAVTERARNLASTHVSTVRLAFSTMRPASNIATWWAGICHEHPGIKLEMVQIPDDCYTGSRILNNMGDEADAMVMIEPLPRMPSRPPRPSPCNRRFGHP